MRAVVTAVVALGLGTTCCLNAQSTPGRVWDANQHGWYMYFGDHQVRGKWGVHLEGQVRRHDVITAWQQLLLRPGVNYQLNDKTLLTLGYAYVKTHPYGEYPIDNAFPEHRLYQQLLVKHRIGTTRLQHRFRTEQRFLGRVIPDNGGTAKVDFWRYQNRFRHFVKAEVPFGRKDKKGPWYGALYNEVFINFAPKQGVTVFDQNRAYAAVGYDYGRIGKLEIGYMNQVLSRRSGTIIEVNHTLQIGFFSNLAFGKP